MLGERAASPVFTRSTCPDEFGNWEDEPAPIHDALVREMGAPA
ncbi:hypothetical protein [Nocardioides alcanivorans]|nr:hypothetical protein [Nocardioides alcanivorans]